MKIKVETEEKYYCYNPKKLIDKIKNLNYKELETKIESDEYFTDIDSQFIKNRTCLRIRKTNDKNMEITFKGKSTSLLGQYCKLENNISANIDEYENLVNLFVSLGFYSYVSVEKERHTFEKSDGNYRYSIMIDKLPNIGGFVEFEIISEIDDAKKEELNLALKAFISKFIDFDLKEETRPYRDVVASYIYSNNSPKEKLQNIYVNIDSILINYEKNFFKKYKDVISKELGISLKWGVYKKNKSLYTLLSKYIDEYLDNLVFDSKELLVVIELLTRMNYNTHYITKTNKVFFKHFLEKLNIQLNEVIQLNDETLSQIIKKYHINLNNSVVLNTKNLKEIISILLVMINNRK